MNRCPLYLGLWLLGAGAGACSASNDAGSKTNGGMEPPPAGTFEPSTATSLAFSEPSIVFVPGDVRTLAIHAEPPRTHHLRFALLGEPLDAFLDRSEVDTLPDGTAFVQLTAPSEATSFSLRASIGGLAAELTASAGDARTSLEVVPQYAGHRPVRTWTATVGTADGCAAYGEVPPPDGPLLAQADAGGKPRVSGVPVGTRLTVTLRAGHFAGGCAELDGAVADGTSSITVNVSDRPLQMKGTSLPVTLGIEATQELIDAWTALGQRMATAFLGDATLDGAALLDAMEAGSSTDLLAAFQAARSGGAWDALVQTTLASRLGSEGLRGTLTRWVVASLETLTRSGMTGTLSSEGKAEGLAVLTLTGVGGVTPAEGGFSQQVEVSWTREPDDRVLFGGKFALKPSTLAAALALEGARTDVLAAKSVPAALAARLACSDVATALVDSGAASALSCDHACQTAACEAALADMWGRAEGLEAEAVDLEIAASGAVADVDDVAHPIAIEGTWVGTTSLGGVDVKVGGPAIGGTSAAP